MSVSRSLSLAIALFSALGLASVANAQLPKANTNPQAQPPAGRSPRLERHEFQAGKAVAEQNKIVQPIPLNAREKEAAMAGIDTHIAEEAATLKGKLKNVLPDELGVLAKTTGWSQEHQNALIVAWRAMDPAAVYKAWSQGSPQDTAGAEIVGRQTDVRRTLSKLDQNIHNHASVKQDLVDLETMLTKIVSATPGAQEVVGALSAIKIWSDVRELVDEATPVDDIVAKLPTGKVSLIFDPTVPVGKVVVLSKAAVLIGNEGKGAITIRQGIAAEHLGLPSVHGQPLRDLQGDEMTGGILLVNPANSGAPITYNAEGYEYTMKPGMTQELPGQSWRVDYDRGGGFGPDSYRLDPGTYHFTATDEGWQIYKQRYDVTLDNTNNPQEFHFLYLGQKMVVPANGTKTLSSIYPIVVRYDRGNGSEMAAKMINFIGNVQVGVNVADNRWDLFPTNSNQRSVTNLNLFK